MVGNYEKMLVITPTTNEWPQIDEKSLMASTSKLMEKPGQELPQTAAVQQQPLKCPRCDSSNTKFCYYNNYSLSQPRHFCKACKRYWTRGGTLRNVPVGGGCRKNKRVKRPAASVSVSAAVEGSPSVSTTTTSNPNSHRIPHHQTQIDHISSTSNPINPLFYGLPTNPPEMNLPFPGGRFNTRVDVESFPGGYDLQPQLSSLALGFSSSGGILSTNDHHANNGFISSSTTKAVQDAVTSNSLLSSYSIFGSSTSTTTTAPTIATLLASNLHQNKFNNGGIKDIRAPPTPSHFQAALTSFEDMHMSSGRNECGAKEVKLEAVGENRLEWSSLPCQNQIEQIGFSDPSIYWNTTSTSVGAWHDPANIGSSVTSLI